jgi:hypothetical protein
VGKPASVAARAITLLEIEAHPGAAAASASAAASTAATGTVGESARVAA